MPAASGRLFRFSHTMQLETHLAVGWLMGNLVQGADRRFRGLVAFSALAPDLDGVSYLLGPDMYSRCHHVLGHNIFAGVLFTLVCTLLARPGWRWMTMCFAVLGFASHWVGDYFFSGWPLMTFWPVSRIEQMHRPRIGLDAPINQVFSYSSLVFFIVSTWWWRRTIFEPVWPAMDRLLVGLTTPRTLRCATCGRATGQRCGTCDKPVCLKHGRVTRKLAVCCESCESLQRDEARPRGVDVLPPPAR